MIAAELLGEIFNQVGQAVGNQLFADSLSGGNKQGGGVSAHSYNILASDHQDLSNRYNALAAGYVEMVRALIVELSRVDPGNNMLKPYADRSNGGKCTNITYIFDRAFDAAFAAEGCAGRPTQYRAHQVGDTYAEQARKAKIELARKTEEARLDKERADRDAHHRWLLERGRPEYREKVADRRAAYLGELKRAGIAAGDAQIRERKSADDKITRGLMSRQKTLSVTVDRLNAAIKDHNDILPEIGAMVIRLGPGVNSDPDYNRLVDSRGEKKAICDRIAAHRDGVKSEIAEYQARRAAFDAETDRQKSALNTIRARYQDVLKENNGRWPFDSVA